MPKINILWLLCLFPACHGPAGAPLEPGPAPSSLYAVSEQAAYDRAYAAIAEALGQAPPRRPEWRYWRSTLAYQYPGGSNQKQLMWTISADFAPGGGGRHASAYINADTGEVVRVHVGKHLR